MSGIVFNTENLPVFPIVDGLPIVPIEDEMSVEEMLAALRPTEAEIAGTVVVETVSNHATVLDRINGKIGTYSGPVAGPTSGATDTASDVKWYANVDAGTYRKHSSKDGITKTVGGRVGRAFYTVNADRTVEYTNSRGEEFAVTIREFRQAVQGHTTAKGIRTPNLYLRDA